MYGPFGKGLPEFGFVNYFIEMAVQNNPISIFGDGSQLRNPLYVGDAADAIFSTIRQAKTYGRVQSVAGPDHISVANIAKAIVSEFESGSVVHTPWPDDRARIEVGDVQVSPDSLSKLVEWAPKYRMADGLRRTREMILEYR